MSTIRKGLSAKRLDPSRTPAARAAAVAHRAAVAERYTSHALNVDALAAELHSMPVGVAR